MKKNLFILSIALALTAPCFSQEASGKLIFSQGQTISITMEVKNTVSQEAGGNAFDIKTEGMAIHEYKVTNSTADNTTLHHDVKKITFKFDGMGQNRSFDSDNQKDLNGFFGSPVKDILSKSYDIIIDPSGKTLLVKPEKIELAKTDDRLAIVLNMLKEITSIVFPPKKNESSFFKILPDTSVTINDSWTETYENENGKTSIAYTLSALTDSTIVVDLKGKSSSVTKADMMGMPTTTNMNSRYAGKVILDRATGIVKEKTITAESTGNTEAMGGNMPVTAKTTISIYVSPFK